MILFHEVLSVNACHDLKQWRIPVVWENIKFSFFNKKCVELAISDFKMHLIISKWLRIQKCREKRKTTWQVEAKEKAVNRNYAIDHASIHFFFYVNSLLLLIPFVLLAAYFKHRLLLSSHNLIAIHIFYVNILFFLKNNPLRIFLNVNLTNFENV